MPEMMDRLHAEHRNIARVLGALEHQLDVFAGGGQPDFDVLSAAADYFTGFPDRCHHPKEDLLFRKLRERAPEAAAAVEDLEAEHGTIAQEARRFREATDNVLKEVEVSRQAYERVARQFIADQRRHLEMEEANVFPLAEKVLTPEDWAEIDSRIGAEEDPVFGPHVAGEYRALHDAILAWDREHQERAAKP